MGFFTFTDENTSSISPSRIFKASIIDSHNLIPKILPQAVKSIDILQGDGGAGTIKQINFQGGSFVKHQTDEIDEKTYTYKYTLIEGDGLGEKIEKVSYEIKFEETADGGTASKMITKCYTKGEFELKEEEINAGKEKVTGMFKVVEAYLLENPDAYV